MRDQAVKIWSIDGELLNTLTRHNDEVWSLAVMKNGDIVSGSHNAVIKIWSIDGVFKKNLMGHTLGIRRLAEHPNG
jgi:WD40 repeat protein